MTPTNRRANPGIAYIALLLIVVLTGCAQATTPSTGAATGSSVAPTTTASPTTTAVGPANPTPGTTVTVALGARPFTMYVPTGYRPGTEATLLVALHGYSSQAAHMREFFELTAVADRENILVATPQGTSDSHGNGFWNAFHSCCNFDASTVDDSTYLSQVISTVSAQYSVDPRRVYMIGHSNGGFMAYRFACDHADQVTAVASVSGAMDTDAACSPARPVGALQVHGDKDAVIQYAGGTNNGATYTSASQTATVWRHLNGCPDKAGRSGAPLDADERVPGDDVRSTTWSGCRNGTGVGLWTITGGDHQPILTAAFAAALVSWLDAHRRTS